MKTNCKLLLLLSVVLSSGCAHTYKRSDLQVLSAPLDATKNVLVSVPSDGWHEDIQYKNSGRMTANAVRAAFALFAPTVDLAEDCPDSDCLKNIDPSSYGYYVKPEILSWEDRATEWSGRPDRIQLQVSVYDTATKKTVASSSYSGKSKWATFGGDHPQDLLAEPTESYVTSLYGGTHEGQVPQIGKYW